MILKGMFQSVKERRKKSLDRNVVGSRKIVKKFRLNNFVPH